MKRLLAAALVLPALLISCASSKAGKVFVTNLKRVPLLPADAISREIDSYQLFRGSFGASTLTAPLYLTADGNGIQIVLLNDFGLEMGTISYDGEHAEMEAPLFREAKPEYILLDLQNAYADADRLTEHYGRHGLSFTERIDGEGVHRQVANGDEVIEDITISPDGSAVRIVNHLRDYEYNLTEESE